MGRDGFIGPMRLRVRGAVQHVVGRDSKQPCVCRHPMPPGRGIDVLLHVEGDLAPCGLHTVCDPMPGR